MALLNKELDKELEFKKIQAEEELAEDETLQPLSDSFVPDGVLRDYIDLVSPLSEAPLQFHIASGLMLLAAVCKRNIYLPFGAGNIFPNLYVLILGESGIARKSEALKPALKLLYELDPTAYLGSLTSLEAFYEAFKESSNKVGFYGEFKALIDNFNRKYGRGLQTEMTNLWDNPNFMKVNLKNVPIEDRLISEPCFSILGATTIEWLQLREMDITGGFFGRFLPILASKGRDKLMSIPPTMDMDKYQKVLDGLRAVSNIQGEIRLTEGAVKLQDEIYRDLWKKYEELPDQNLMNSHWSRIHTHILKLAMLFTVSRRELVDSIENLSPNGIDLSVDEDAILRASSVMEKITGYYKNLLANISFSEEIRMENRILNKLKEKREKGATKSELMRFLRVRKGFFNEIVETLDEKHLIVSKNGEKTSAGRPKTTYFLSKYTRRAGL